jgi:hypothetical protein
LAFALLFSGCAIEKKAREMRLDMVGNDVYLGDALFASFDGYQIELYTTDGIRKTDQVYLEPAVLAAFLHYIESLKKAAEEEV